MESIVRVYETKREQADKLVKKYKSRDVTISWMRLVAFLILLIAIYFLLTSNPIIYGVISLVIAAGIVFLVFHHQNIRNQRRSAEASSAFFEREINYLQNNLESLEDGKEYSDPEHIYADDLNLFGEFSFYRHINRSITFRGNEKFVNLFRNQEPQDIKKRQEAIKELSQKREFRNHFLIEGLKNPDKAKVYERLTNWINTKAPTHIAYNPIIINGLSSLSLLSCIYMLWIQSTNSLYLFAGLMIFNSYLAFSALKKVAPYYEMIEGLRKSMKTYESLLSLTEEETFQSQYFSELGHDKVASQKNPASEVIKSLGSICNSFDSKDNGVGAFLFNGLFMYHLRVFKNLEQWKEKNSDKVLSYFEYISSLDVLVSLSTYAYHHPDFIYPEILSEVRLEAQNIKHPLIPSDQSVPNSIIMEDGQYIVLTGSNMSGKSTFLRTLGSNLFLMKLGCPVHTSKFASFPFTIATSMQVSDALSENTSFFLAEIKRLQKLKKTIEESEYVFLLLDEILRGTNSDDKREGTVLFLKDLAQKNAMGIIATHDVEVAKLGEGASAQFRNYYFKSDLEGEELSFDYRLRKGVCHSPNATQLLINTGIIKPEQKNS